MKYNDLLDYLSIYGTTKEDIIKRRGYEKMLENVVVAPWWEHTIFSSFSNSIEQVGDKVYNVYGDNFSFSFIEIKNMGASSILEEVLALGVTVCKKVLFIGSAGSLDETIKIGDLAVPVYSINGVGATRYLNKNLEDDFEEKYYPDANMTNQLIETIKKMKYEYNEVENYSVDTIISQFPHIKHIKNLNAKTIEMETSSFFKCCNLIGVQSSALFVISDNTIENKSLYSGRNEEDKIKKKKARKEILPSIIVKFFGNN